MPDFPLNKSTSPTLLCAANEGDYLEKDILVKGIVLTGDCFERACEVRR
jgi:hypothetical protein